MKKQIPVALKGYNHKTLLTISTVIEIEDNIVKDSVFLTFFPASATSKIGYNQAEKQTMLLNVNDLRALEYGCRELLKVKQKIASGADTRNIGHYRKFTSKENITKSITLMVQETQNSDFLYWINYSDNQKHQIGLGMNIFDFMAFIDSIKLIADETDKKLYLTQRKLKSDIGEG